MADDARTAAQLHALAETTPDVLVVIDTDSRIRYVNPAVEDVLGYPPQELVGDSLTALMSDELGRRHLRAIDRYLETETRRLTWDRIELPGKHRDGNLVPLEITFSEFTLDGDRFFTGVLRDISERKALEGEKDLLHTAKDRVVEAESLSDSLRNTVRLVGESMNWAYGEAWISDDEADELTFATAWESDDVDFGDFAAASARATFEPGEGLVGHVWQRGEYEWIPDIAAEGVAFERTAAATAAGIRTALGVPIRTDGTVVAVLVFLATERQSFDERTIEITETVAANLGLLVGRKRAEDALREERNLLSNVLQTSPVGIAVMDADGTFAYANHRSEEILRMSPDADGAYPPIEDLPIRVFDAEGDALSGPERPFRTVFRSNASVARNVEIEYADGDRCWLSVRGTPLRNDAGAVTRAVVVFQDVTEQRRRADRLERLNELGRDLADVASAEEACERAAAAAASVLDLPVASVERYDHETGRLEPCARTDSADDAVEEAPLFPEERDFLWQAFGRNEIRVYSDLASETTVDADETSLSSVVVVPMGRHGILVGGATESDAFSETTVTLAEILAGNVEAAFDRLERERDLRERTTELETKNSELQRVQRVSGEILDLTRALRNATSQAEIKQVVCDRLAASDQYELVWFGERDPATDEIRAVASAGDESGYLDAVTATGDESETGLRPAGRAVRTGEAQIQNDLRSDPPFEPWRQAAVRRDYRASMSVPVASDGALFGVLNLYANEPGVFSDLEEAALTEFGEMIGYALNAMDRYDALVSEAAVELVFVVRDASNPLLNFLRDRAANFTLENIRGRSEGSIRAFVSFEEVSFEEIRSFFGQLVDEDDLTLVREGSEETIVEVLLPEGSFVATLLDRGAVPSDVRGTPDEGRITIRIPKSASVREFVELFEAEYDDVELVARRESPDPVKTREEFERAYVDRLTERQREVLQTAYFAGFFEQPRANTARDVAEMLDVSQPTVSRHLRSCQNALFSMLFDGE